MAEPDESAVNAQISDEIARETGTAAQQRCEQEEETQRIVEPLLGALGKAFPEETAAVAEALIARSARLFEEARAASDAFRAQGSRDGVDDESGERP